MERVLKEPLPVNRIDPALRAALAAPGYRETFARAVLHADTTIRRYIWRGYRPKYTGSNEIMVGDKTAKDFVSEALVRLMDGRRTFDAVGRYSTISILLPTA